MAARTNSNARALGSLVALLPLSGALLAACSPSNATVTRSAQQIVRRLLRSRSSDAHLYLVVGAPVLVSTGHNTWQGTIPVKSRLITSTVQVPVRVLSDGERVVVEGLRPRELIVQLVHSDETPPVSSSDAWTASKPPRFRPASVPVGDCFTTSVMRVTTRLAYTNGAPVRGSGSALIYSDGVYQVRYAQVAAMDGSRPGDSVTLCVRSHDRTCRSSSWRGNDYDAYDHRTEAAWQASDSEHSCAGA